MCLDKNAISFSNAGANIGTDLVLVVMPLVVLRKLEIPKREKVVFYTVLGVGLSVPAVSVVRLVWLYLLSLAPPQEQSGKVYPLCIHPSRNRVPSIRSPWLCS